jgi:hypothetical protein
MYKVIKVIKVNIEFKIYFSLNFYFEIIRFGT